MVLHAVRVIGSGVNIIQTDKCTYNIRIRRPKSKYKVLTNKWLSAVWESAESSLPPSRIALNQTELSPGTCSKKQVKQKNLYMHCFNLIFFSIFPFFLWIKRGLMLNKFKVKTPMKLYLYNITMVQATRMSCVKGYCCIHKQKESSGGI